MENNSQSIQRELGNRLNHELSGLEALRKSVLVKVILTGGCWMILFLSSLVFITWKIYQFISEEFRKTHDHELVWIGIGILLLLYIIAGLSLRKIQQRIIHRYLSQGEYAARYKKEVIGKVLPSMLEGVAYNPEQGISAAEFRESGFPLFSNPARYYSSGEIKGVIGKTSFRFAEVWAESFIEEEHSPGQYADLFRGMFFIVDLQKNTDSNTLIYPDKVKYFSSLLLGKLSEEKPFSRQGFQRVKLEDVTFEKHFEVYGTDQTEARYLLSPALMERMVALTEISKKMIQFSFRASSAYFGIYYPGGKDLLAAPLFTSVYNLRTVEKHVADIHSMMKVIKELNMNAHLV